MAENALAAIGARPMLARFSIACAALLALLAVVAAPKWADAQSVSSPAPSGIISASSGNVAAGVATATLPATPGQITYICGFSITSAGSTAAAVVNPTVVGLNGGTQTYVYTSVAGATLANAQLVVNFNACLPGANPNTAIVVSMPSLGAGNTNTAVDAWGFVRP